MTQQPDNQNVSEKRDQSSTESDTTTSSNLNDLVGKSRQATNEADEALKKAGQGGQPGGQSVQEKEQGWQSTNSQNTKRQDDIADPNKAQGSSSDGDSASD